MAKVRAGQKPESNQDRPGQRAVEAGRVLLEVLDGPDHPPVM